MCVCVCVCVCVCMNATSRSFFGKCISANFIDQLMDDDVTNNDFALTIVSFVMKVVHVTSIGS